MHAPLAVRLDPWRAAAAGTRLEGDVAPERMPRLAAHANPDGPLGVVISLTREGSRAVRIELRVRGRYRFTCQRCLEPLALEREDRSSVQVVPDEAAARAALAGSEVLVSAPGEMLDLASLVEDEVLLGLPFAPCHAWGKCRPELAARVPEPPPPRSNPFAVLETLLRRDDG